MKRFLEFVWVYHGLGIWVFFRLFWYLQRLRRMKDRLIEMGGVPAIKYLCLRRLTID